MVLVLTSMIFSNFIAFVVLCCCHVYGRVSLSTCTIECGDNEGIVGDFVATNVHGGRVGKQGPKGEKGETGSSCNCPDKSTIVDEVLNGMNKLGTWSNPAHNCTELVGKQGYANGIYVLKDNWGDTYQTYCDFTTDGGGWNLVLSIHENFMQGHCTIGDRWSSEHGNNATHPHGDGNWENFVSFGRASSASSDDYKSPAYSALSACDLMVWHVPNNTPMSQYEEKAFMKYHTNRCAFNEFDNLWDMFANHYPIRDKTFTLVNNGPAYPVTWNRGDNNVLIANTAPNARAEIDPGFIQFRVINNERGSYAFCPGKIKPNKGNVETMCYGSSSYFSGHINSHKYCGDFGVRDWNGYATGLAWSSNKLMSESVVMIFYR